MAGQLDGKVALVTGGGSGIGRASALAFAREGARVVVADIDAEGGDETGRLIKSAGGEACSVRADVSKAAEVEALVARTIETYGRLDCAHNNAGVAGVSALPHELAEEAWDQLMAVNLKGVWLCIKYEVPRMLAQGSGAIVNTASVAGLVAAPTMTAYSTSKHGVNGLTKVAALAYAQRGIRVNSVCPGWIRTPMVERVLEHASEAEAMMLAMEPVGRLGTPEEVAEAVVWLCSDAASFVTGHTMVVDGGLVAR